MPRDHNSITLHMPIQFNWSNTKSKIVVVSLSNILDDIDIHEWRWNRWEKDVYIKNLKGFDYLLSLCVPVDILKGFDSYFILRYCNWYGQAGLGAFD